ncbi:hypothetical protein T02_5614 [Trichinella nativa]|uniref:Uncharacterized protein n=1 Tax=Trichinella nativa TaxID=6335 RepID=A0A0V1L9V0_9BILA|nr:hypothetical protein T06_7793 [Trichinella sp. T6]KRZ56257.1 hypothetical protein T02_5614 [Trichinella nativa]
MGFLFTIPNCSRHRELLAHAVLVYRTQRPSAKFRRFLVMSFQPHCLQFCVRTFGESVAFQNVIQFAKVAHVKSDQSAGASKKFGCATGNDHKKRARRSTSPLSSKVSQTLATCSLLKLSIGTGGTGGKKAAAGAGKAANAPDAVLNGTHMAGASGLCPNKPSRLNNRISGGGGSSSSNSKVVVVGKIFTIRKYQPAWPVQVNIVPVAETRGGARWRLSVKIC